MRKRYLKTILLTFPICFLFSMTAFAAPPHIAVTGISDGPAPYTFTFAVSDDTGLSSITVNGRELGPNGGTYYDAEWSSYHPGEFNITAIDNEGNTTTKNVSVPGGGVSVPETTPPPVVTQPALPPETAPPAIPETTVAVTAPETRPPETTVPETTPVETTVPETEAETETSQEAETEELPTEPEESIVFMEDDPEETTAEPALEEIEAPDISGLLNANNEIPTTISIPELYYIRPIVDTAVNAHPELSISLPAVHLPKEFIYSASDRGEDITYTMPEAPDITNEVMLASEKSDCIVQIHGEYTPVSMLSYKEGDRNMMPYYLAVLLLAVFALYNISVVILNSRRLKLYKAYILALAGKRKTSPDALIEKAVAREKNKQKKSRSPRRKNRKTSDAESES